MPDVSQASRNVSVSSPLGKDVLLLRSMNATERLGRPFEIALSLYSEDHSIAMDDVVGQAMTVELEQPDGSSRFFNGFVSRFAQTSATSDLSTYEATLVPWLWFLSRTADCRIFQEKTAAEIIQEVFRDAGFTDFEDALTGSYRQRDYCVQYRESDFDFVSRLMEEEGIYYFFEHKDGNHVLILADSGSAHQVFPGYAEVLYRPEGTSQRLEHISEWSVRKDLKPGVYALNDFDFKAPSKDLLSKSVVSRGHASSDFEIYDYPGVYTEGGDGESYAKVRLEELQAAHEVGAGSTNAQGIAAGFTFKMIEHPRKDQCREYLVTESTVSVSADSYSAGGGGGGTTFACGFTAIDSAQAYRSVRQTPRPMVRGPQTAMVVGKSGEEIWTDEHGRVKVQFHWDRYGKSDENSSCWIRVSQAWAGKQWGAMHVPRIGQEVIVEFLEGNPDRPIVTGRVYNGTSQPPWDLPKNATQSGIKTRSCKSGTGETFNEIRFEDKKDSEEIYIHAERDMNRVVENDDTLKVGFDHKDKGDQTIEIYHDREVTLEKGDDTLTVKTGKRTVDVKKTIEIKAGDKITLKCGQSQIVLKKDGTIEIKGVQIKVTGKAKIDLKSNGQLTGKGMQTKVEGTMLDLSGSAMAKLKGGVTMIG